MCTVLIHVDILPVLSHPLIGGVRPNQGSAFSVMGISVHYKLFAI
jgi:hypothetical protein